jgi:hypothetical protein
MIKIIPNRDYLDFSTIVSRNFKRLAAKAGSETVFLTNFFGVSG